MTDIVSNETAEKALASKPGLRVTEERIQAKISDVQFFEVKNDDDTPLGVQCMIVMKNGWVSTGFSAPVSPENYDIELGRKYSYEKAFKPLWELEGYLLKDQVHAINEILMDFDEEDNPEECGKTS